MTLTLAVPGFCLTAVLLPELPLKAPRCVPWETLWLVTEATASQGRGGWTCLYPADCFLLCSIPTLTSPYKMQVSSDSFTLPKGADTFQGCNVTLEPAKRGCWRTQLPNSSLGTFIAQKANRSPLKFSAFLLSHLFTSFPC